MDKLKMQTPDLTDKNIEQIAQLFPNVITETKDEDGTIKKAVDFDLLKQVLSKTLVEDDNERYRLDWPGKKASLLKANTPIIKTLRPFRKESVNFDTTENLYIEGDNFEVLKILQESYLGKVKMIYIDPPYNTGTAMVYHNDFSKSEDEYDEDIGAIDEGGGKLFKNTESNGRFHSDWISMMYERLIVSRDLLTNDGFIAIAIDHNELHSLISICDEIFGETNRLGVITVVHKPEGRNQEKFFGTSNEFMLVYSKNKDFASFNKVAIDNDIKDRFDKIDEYGNYRLKNFIRLTDGKYSLRESKPNFYYPIYVSSDLKKFSLKKSENYEEVFPIASQGVERTWKTTKDTFLERAQKGDIVAIKENNSISLYEKLREDQVIKTHWIKKEYHSYHFGTKLLEALLNAKTFDFPKSINLILDVLKLMLKPQDIILDFFSGSATTAHAVMQLNAEDGGNRKFIMVQLPEKTDENSEAYKAGYKTIAEIGKERIRRAGKKIVEELKMKTQQLKIGEEPVDASKLDIGFRVYKTDDTNMKDVFYHPAELDQKQLAFLESNIKEDRTPEDLLTQVILDLGLELSLPVETKKMLKNTVFIVQANALVACFDNDIDFKIIDIISDLKPFKVVFKDASFKDDKDRINVEERFKRLSPETKVTVI
ncbi:site-specific DNA-methyltransferase [bacterium]|nr:MAG: site-specific DNA-methyltransferase [bacterium]